MKNQLYRQTAEQMFSLLPLIKRYFHHLNIPEHEEIPRHLYAVLLTSFHCGKKNMTSIADFLGISKPLMTQQVDKLVENGFMDREFNPEDRRIIEISLTQKGQKTAETIKKTFGEKAAILLSSLSLEDIDLLYQNLSSANQILKKIKIKQCNKTA